MIHSISWPNTQHRTLDIILLIFTASTSSCTRSCRTPLLPSQGSPGRKVSGVSSSTWRTWVASEKLSSHHRTSPAWDRSCRWIRCGWYRGRECASSCQTPSYFWRSNIPRCRQLRVDLPRQLPCGEKTKYEETLSYWSRVAISTLSFSFSAPNGNCRDPTPRSTQENINLRPVSSELAHFYLLNMIVN